MIFQQFNGPGYSLQSGIIACDRQVNLFCEYVESRTGKSPFGQVSVPGTRSFVTLAGGPLRAMASTIQGPGLNEYMLAIAGNKLYAVDNTATATLIGLVNWLGGAQVVPAQIIPYSANTAFVLSDGMAYKATVSPFTLTPITLPVAFGRTATYIDTYMVISDLDSRQFYISAVGDPTSWNPLDVATKEAAPDFLQAVFATSELLFLFGLETTEIWYDSGAANFPFQRYPGGGVWPVGTTFPYSICKVGDAIMWVGRSDQGTNVVYMARGLQYQRVSNYFVETALAGPDFGAGVAYSYEEQGHFFYVLNSSVSNGFQTTLVYDLTANMWHERGLNNGTFTAGIPNFTAQDWQLHVNAFYASNAAGHYVGGTAKSTDTTATIYLQSMKLYDFHGTPKVCMRLAPHLCLEQGRIRYDRYILDNDKLSNPTINLLWSDDGGVTFGNTHTRVSPTGQSRTIWRQLGSARDRVFCQWSLTACFQAWAAVYINDAPPAP